MPGLNNGFISKFLHWKWEHFSWHKLLKYTRTNLKFNFFPLLLIFITKLLKSKGAAKKQRCNYSLIGNSTPPGAAGKNFHCLPMQVSLFCYEYFMCTIARSFSQRSAELIPIWLYMSSSYYTSNSSLRFIFIFKKAECCASFAKWFTAAVMKKKMILEIFHMEYNSVMISTVLEKVFQSRSSLIYAIRKSNIPVWVKVELWFILKHSVWIQMYTWITFI